MTDPTSAFDPALFLEATTTEAATRRPPLPVENPASADHLYTGLIGEPKMRTWQGKKDPTQSGIAIDIPISIEVPSQLQDQLKLQPNITLTYGFIVDLNAGAIDWAPGRNRQARIVREATSLNVAGVPFSFKMLQGKVVKVKVENDIYNGDVVDKISTLLKG